MRQQGGPGYSARYPYMPQEDNRAGPEGIRYQPSFGLFCLPLSSNKSNLPTALGTVTHIWYKGSWLRVVRIQNEFKANTMQTTPIDSISITQVLRSWFSIKQTLLTSIYRMLTRSHSKLDQMLKEAHAAYKTEVRNRINIRSSYDE